MPVRTDSGGGGGEFQDNPTGVENAVFLGRKSGGAYEQPAFSLAGIRMTTVAFEKEVCFKTIACSAKRFSSTKVKFRT